MSCLLFTKLFSLKLRRLLLRGLLLCRLLRASLFRWRLCRLLRRSRLCNRRTVRPLLCSLLLNGLLFTSLAAAGVRAECVMLNNGPYIVKTVRALDDILRRMGGHHQKGRSTLRKLEPMLANPIFRQTQATFGKKSL